MKSDGLVTLLVVLAIAVAGVIAWKKGLFSKFGAFLTAPPAGPTPAQGVPGGIGPTEFGAAAPGGGSAYGRVCNAVYSTTGKVLQQGQDPRAQAAGIATQAAGPLVCAAQEYVAGKVWDGTKFVAANAGKGIATGAKAAWNNTLGKLF